MKYAVVCVREPEETYVAYGYWSDLKEARTKGLKEAWAARPAEERKTLSSWSVLAVLKGHPKLLWIR